MRDYQNKLRINREYKNRNRAAINALVRERRRLNPEPHRQDVKAWRKANPVKHKANAKKYWSKKNGTLYSRSRKIKEAYGMSMETFYEMLAAQAGLCNCCGNAMTLGTGNQRTQCVVDHDHKTGKIRGLLCNGCNIALGAARDSIRTLQGMIRHLRESGVE